MSYFILVLFLNVLFLVEFLSNIFWLWAKILWLRSLKAFPHFFLHSSHRYFLGFFLRCFSVSWIIRPTLVQLLKLHLIHLKFLPENKQKHVNKHLKKNSKQTTKQHTFRESSLMYEKCCLWYKDRITILAKMRHFHSPLMSFDLMKRKPNWFATFEFAKFTFIQFLFCSFRKDLFMTR